MNLRFVTLTATFFAILTGLAAPALLAAQEADEESLYHRLGGVHPIAVVVDEFIDRVAANDVLNANPAVNEARMRVPLPGIKFHVTALVCQATGGPCVYTGRGMVETHAQMYITDAEWQEMLSVFKAVLTDFEVPQQEQDELVAIVESTKGEIVTSQP